MRAIALAALLSACQFMPVTPEIDCGLVPAEQCEAMAADLIAQARQEFPGKQVARIELSTPDGGYFVEFTDGSGFGVTP